MVRGAVKPMKLVATCWKPLASPDSGGLQSSSSSSSSQLLCPSPFHCGGGDDGRFWSKDLGRHAHGDFSMAVVQANTAMEDSSQIESGPVGSCSAAGHPPPPHATFAGVFDGHGGFEASRYVASNLFGNLKGFASERAGMSADILRSAILATEDGFLASVRKHWLVRPQIASVGTCCLVGVVCGGVLYVGNLGDSRAVLGVVEGGFTEARAVQLTAEHNASDASVRDELRLSHPDDPQIVVMKHNVWRVRGLIQISRSIGDAYLKDPEFNKAPLIAKFRLSETFRKPILSSEPSIVTHKLSPQDRFVIFASDGLWEHLSNQETVDIVQSYRRAGIAARLVKTAMRESAKKREVRYTDLKRIETGLRRNFHDDISVIVIFLDPSLASGYVCDGPVVSLRGDESLRKQIIHTR